MPAVTLVIFPPHTLFDLPAGEREIDTSTPLCTTDGTPVLLVDVYVQAVRWKAGCVD
jgi:hypothetical protein